MKLITNIIFCSLFLSSTVFAATFVDCGKSVDLENGSVSERELTISSVDDNYSGPVGLNWDLKIKEQKDWLKPNKNVTATMSQVEGDTVVEIIFKRAQSVSGPVGTKYILTGLYNEEPTLEKYTIGGFAGNLKTDTFKCIGSVD